MPLKLQVDGVAYEVEIVGRRPHLTLRIDGRLHAVTATGHPGDGPGCIALDGSDVAFTRAEGRGRQAIRLNGRTFDTALVDPRSEAEGASGAQGAIKAPMPGAVVSLHKAVGDAVTRGETIVTIESMKLQTALGSPRDGIVAALLKREGETFDKDEIIARLEDPAGEPA